MSDSELSDAPSGPSDALLESTLRHVVRDALKKSEDITVRIARSRTEEELGLDTDFFTSDEWKKRSKEIISAAVEEPDSPVKEKPKAGRKRKSEEPAEKPKKRAKKSPVVESDEDAIDEEDEIDEDSEEEVEKPKSKIKAKAKPKAKSQPKAKAKPRAKAKAASPVVESDEEEQESPEPKSRAKKAPSIDSEDEDENESTADATSKEQTVLVVGPSQQSPPEPKDKPDSDNESEMSVLIDDPPPKKKGGRPKKSTSREPSAGPKPAKPAKKAATATATSKDPLSNDEEEIKRLQSWLLKCGVRKLWHRELAPFDTPKAKISHLKSMLTQAGMTGRFSAEKAKGIKEAKELADELAAARDFEEKFGTGGRGRRGKAKASMKEAEISGDEEDEDEKAETNGPKRPGGRALPKGLVDFGDSGDDGSD